MASIAMFTVPKDIVVAGEVLYHLCNPHTIKVNRQHRVAKTKALDKALAPMALQSAQVHYAPCAKV